MALHCRRLRRSFGRLGAVPLGVVWEARAKCWRVAPSSIVNADLPEGVGRVVREDRGLDELGPGAGDSTVLPTEVAG